MKLLNALGVCVCPLVLFVNSVSGSQNGLKKIEESFVSEWDESYNIDSLAVWHNTAKDIHWIFATSKSTHQILVFDAVHGKQITSFGKKGKRLGEMNRPNGIAIVQDMLFVVERNNHRVQVFSLPDMIPITYFGTEALRYPYGISVVESGQNNYSLYITDDYSTDDGSIPPSTELGRRVQIYRVQKYGKRVVAQFQKAFGDTEGPGILNKVESIAVDLSLNQVLVADEVSQDIKVYRLDGTFTGTVFGKNLIQAEPEGIALVECANQQGYWIVTDQNKPSDRNIFYIFKRGSFEYLGGFYGAETSNTDGIVLSQVRMPGFASGAFYAVNNDGGINAFSLEGIGSSLNLPLNLPFNFSSTPPLGFSMTNRLCK